VLPRHGWCLGLGLAVAGVLLVAVPGGAGILDASWTAPTTNADGSPLTDLAGYRVYYGASTPPCPGSAFFQVASSTASPPPNRTVTFRLTGLAAGTVYNVSITAVDTGNNESTCSTFASAAARIEFGLSPTGTVNFGSVILGSFADRPLTVQNTVGGTISGAVVVSAPFSVVSGSPFSLTGAGASQTVTVRFTPIAPVTTGTNVNVTANGDTLSRLLTGTGVALDPTPPTVAITSPTSSATYSTTSSALTLGGTASDNVGVTQVAWTNSAGGTGTASGTASWTASGITLKLGTNVLTVTARDAAGNTGTARLTVTLSGSFSFTDDPLAAQGTTIKAAHIMELRAAIDSLRVAYGLAAFQWLDPTLTPGITPATALHLTELRAALDQAYVAAGRALPTTYTDPLVVAGKTSIKAIHLDEIRAAARGL